MLVDELFHLKARCQALIKKILVTGGAGFIGSHLCEELVKNRNNEVWSLDNYSTGFEQGLAFLSMEKNDEDF